jgi:hypothetical protein
VRHGFEQPAEWMRRGDSTFFDKNLSVKSYTRIATGTIVANQVRATTYDCEPSECVRVLGSSKF